MKSRKKSFKPWDFIICLIILIWSGGPILLILLSSFKIPREIFSYPPKLFFRPTLMNFRNLFSTWPQFSISLINSLIITIFSAILTVSLSSLAGFAYSRYRSRTLQFSAFYLIVIRMLPPIVITIPLYPIAYALNLFDKHFLLILLYTAFFLGLGTILMKSFIDEIPIELDEVAYIDGASRFRVFISIILPLAKHGMMATSTFVIIFAWKEYFYALLFTTTKAKTAPLMISEMMGSVTGVDWGPVFAAAMIQLLPILVFVYFIQKLLSKGITLGAVKG